MSQRVNLQYSITIEQLPYELGRLINKTNANLNSITKIDVNDDETANITLDTIKQIEQTRASLYAVDQELMDIQNMINGYINFMTRNEEENHQQDGEEMYTQEEIVEDLESKIQNFKNNFVQKMRTDDQVPTEEHSNQQPVTENNT